MNKAPRKLTLTRETLAPLQTSELTAVNGGTSPATPAISVASRATFIASVRFCSAVSAFSVNQAQQGFTGVQRAVETAKKVTGRLLQPPAHTPPFELARFGPGVSR
jgi:hypothetical protein